MSAPLHDGELVASYARGGSESAFRALVQRHVDLVFATALRQVGDRGIAEEITQNTFIALTRKAPRLARFETLAGWLHRTTVLEARARVRSELRRKERERVAVDLAEIQRSSDSPFAPLLPLLDEALLTLGDIDRAALISRFIQERSLRDVGSLLGIGEEAARKRVSRSLDKLGLFFRKRGIALPGTAAALLTAAIETAPASAAASAGQLALTAAIPATGLKLLFFNAMCASNVKVTAACLLMIAGPLLWQQRFIATARAESSAAGARLRETQQDLFALTAEQAGSEAERGRLELERQEALQKLAAVPQSKSVPVPQHRYRWDDSAALARVPKDLLRSIHLAVITDRRGQLDPQFVAAAQVTAPEAKQIQSALNKFLQNIRAAEQEVMHPVEPDPQELPEHKREDVRAFEIGDITERLSSERAELFATASEVLGPERFQIFKEGLRSWIPLSEPDQGVSASMAVFDGRHRVYFGKPLPGVVDRLPWGMAKPGMAMNGSITIEEIPEIFAPALQDWIQVARANQKAAANEKK